MQILGWLTTNKQLSTDYFCSAAMNMNKPVELFDDFLLVFGDFEVGDITSYHILRTACSMHLWVVAVHSTPVTYEQRLTFRKHTEYTKSALCTHGGLTI